MDSHHKRILVDSQYHQNHYLTVMVQSKAVIECLVDSHCVQYRQAQVSCIMRKPTFCIRENKDADQLHGGPEADQCLYFRYLDSALPLLPKYKISSLYPSPVAVQPGLCQTWSESTLLVFSRCSTGRDLGRYRPCVKDYSVIDSIQFYFLNHQL